MGCDIHLFLEKKLKKDKVTILMPEIVDDDGNVKQDEIKFVQKASEAKWTPCSLSRDKQNGWSDRIYGMFALLAGVRNYGEFEQMIPDRGLPDDICDNTFFKYVSIPYKNENDSNEDNSYHPKFGCPCVSEDLAQRWVAEGTSVKMERYDEKFISSPDHHTPNWCTTEEMETCVNKLFFEKYGKWHGDYEEWTSLVGYMKGVELSGDYECRAVFWFDN